MNFLKFRGSGRLPDHKLAPATPAPTLAPIPDAVLETAALPRPGPRWPRQILHLE